MSRGEALGARRGHQIRKPAGSYCHQQVMLGWTDDFRSFFLQVCRVKGAHYRAVACVRGGSQQGGGLQVKGSDWDWSFRAFMGQRPLEPLKKEVWRLRGLFNLCVFVREDQGVFIFAPLRRKGGPHAAGSSAGVRKKDQKLSTRLLSSMRLRADGLKCHADQTQAPPWIPFICPATDMLCHTPCNQAEPTNYIKISKLS